MYVRVCVRVQQYKRVDPIPTHAFFFPFIDRPCSPGSPSYTPFFIRQDPFLFLFHLPFRRCLNTPLQDKEKHFTPFFPTRRTRSTQNNLLSTTGSYKFARKNNATLQYFAFSSTRFLARCRVACESPCTPETPDFRCRCSYCYRS